MKKNSIHKIPKFILLFVVMISLTSINTTQVNAEETISGQTQQTAYVNGKVVSASVYNHTIAVTDSGKVYTWGLNDNGQLGNGTTESSSFPIDITSRFPSGNGKIIQAAVGNKFTIALTESGKVYTWGYNYYGQLGDGTTESSTTPINITYFLGLNSSDKVVQVFAGSYHAVVLTERGQVYTWGFNAYGQLGDDTTTNRKNPLNITNKIGDGTKKIVQLSVAPESNIVLTENDQVYSWGSNYYGQLGDGTTNNKKKPENITYNIPLTSDDKIKQLAIGNNHTMILTENGKIYTCGRNSYGQLGNDDFSNKAIPIELTNKISLSSKDKVVQISVGFYHSVALTELGQVYSWGYNNHGQLGDGTTTLSSQPINITDNIGLEDDIVIKTIVGYNNTAVITQKGFFYMLGANDYSQLGIGIDIYVATPERVAIEEKILMISTSINHTIALSENGQVYIWGSNSNGQLGNGTTAKSNVPVNITQYIGVDTSDKIVQVSAGYYHTIALSENGQVYTWGSNAYGELGNGASENSNLPINITSKFKLTDDKIIQVSAGYYHTIALSENGKVYTWGRNSSGQLGNGTNVDSYLPKDITQNIGTNMGKVIKIETGDYRTLVITENGQVYIWGAGHLGNGLTSNSNSPVDITSKFYLTNDKIIQATLGGYQSLAVSEKGKVYGWGSNSSGQLVGGITPVIYSPVNVTDNITPVDEKIIQVVTGYYHSLAVTESGKVYSWGVNNYGQLGDKTTLDRITPVDITANIINGVDKVIQITANSQHTLALTDKGEVYSWGYDNLSQLGTGYRSYFSSFYKIATRKVQNPVSIIGDSIRHITVNNSFPSLDIGGGSGTGKKVCKSLDENILTIDEDNIITIKKAGTVQVAVKKIGDDEYLDSSEIIYTIIIEKANQNALVIENDIINKMFQDTGFIIDVQGGSGEGKLAYQSSDEDILIVDKNGKVTFKKIGKAKVDITKSGDDNYYGSSVVTITIVISKGSQALLVIDDDVITKTIKDNNFMLRVDGGSGTGKTIYQSSDEDIVTVDENGQVKIKKIGTADIIIKKIGDDNYFDSPEITCKIIIEPLSINETIILIMQSIIMVLLSNVVMLVAFLIVIVICFSIFFIIYKRKKFNNSIKR